MNTVDALFELFGGPAEIGRAIRVTTEHAASMRRRGSIPPAYWPRLVAAAEEKRIDGVNFEALAVLAASRSPTTQQVA